MLITRAEVEGRGPLAVRVTPGGIAAIGAALVAAPDEPVLDAAGGAVLPGLHDHHLHLLALAAAEGSVRCGPPDVRSPGELHRALTIRAREDDVRAGGEAPAGGAPAGPPAGDAASAGARGWIRGVGYHESVAGDLDRHALDRIVADRPVRVQHRSGALWILNSTAVACVGLERDAGAAGVEAAAHVAGVEPADAAGVERDAAGRPTGRLFRLDAWLRGRLAPREPPSLAPVGRRLAGFGVTGVTDATVDNDAASLAVLAAAARAGDLPQRVLAMGPLALPAPPPGVEPGPVKILLEERALPALDDLGAAIAAAHARGRAVAVHCVTRAEVVLAAAAFEQAGARPGDRLEHASIAPPEIVALIGRLPLTVVTQPGFVHERGDAYLTEVAPRDRRCLYRLRGFLAAGIPLGAGTDAPFGDPDPWRAMRAAVDRRTILGSTLGLEERLSPEEALALFTASPEAPGGPARRVAIGAPADLCLLDRPWAAVRGRLTSAHVRATLRAGRVLWQRG